MKVAVIGASGLVGDAVVRQLDACADIDVKAFIHSSGNAWSLLARGIKPKQLDLLDRAAVFRALDQCTHVVNCSRGGDDVMLNGLKNLLEACRRIRVSKFVHISSVAVYGDPPHKSSVTEAGDTRPAKGSYGWVKLAQDNIVRKYAGKDLPSVILCPPNIIGPNSYFLNQIRGSIDSGRFRLVNNAPGVCNTVDVRNLSMAIHCALQSDETTGARLFVTDQEETSWEDIVAGLQPVLFANHHVPVIDTFDIESALAPRKETKLSVLAALKHIISSDVREALRKDPMWNRIDTFARSLVAKLGSRNEERIRLGIEGPVKIEKKAGIADEIDIGLIRQQLRDVRHSSDAASLRIRYEPKVSVNDSLAAFCSSFMVQTGMNDINWDLARRLYADH